MPLTQGMTPELAKSMRAGADDRRPPAGRSLMLSSFTPRRLALPVLTLLLGFAAGFTAVRPAQAQAKPNVLFIAIDDLNHWVGHLGRNSQVRTPNIDRLAGRGVSFSRAYCAAPACNPSRAALLSGLRPSTTGVYENSHDWRPHIPVQMTLPSHFRSSGYYVAGAGKIYHGGFDRDGEWDEYMPRGGGSARPAGPRRNPPPAAEAPPPRPGIGGIQFAPLDTTDEQMPDYRMVSWIIERLNQPREKPFFLAAGLVKPHMPWSVPKKYFDMFPLDEIQLPPQPAGDLDDIPPAGQRMARAFGDHERVLASGRWKEAVQAYLASIAFADAMVGRLLDALDASPAAADTVVVLWGDHGWSLGEKEHWRKFALWEEPTRAPLLFAGPGIPVRGAQCHRTVDFISIYPTLADLCGLPIPGHVEGPSLGPLLRDPAAKWDRAALTTQGFGNHAVRTEKWRYIRYADGSEELYDEIADPLELENLAGRPEMTQVKSELAAALPSVNSPAVARRGAGAGN